MGDPLVYRFNTCVRTSNSFLFVPVGRSSLVDLSEATRLDRVAFLFGGGPGWVARTLRTITPNHNLQQISLSLSISIEDRDNFEDAACNEWLELDRVLSQLWEWHSVRPKVMYWVSWYATVESAMGCMKSLLPEVATRGVVDLEGKFRRPECKSRGLLF